MAPALNVIAVIGLAAGLGWWMAAVRPGMHELLLGGIALTLGLPILHRWATGTFDILEPLTIFVGMYGLLFFVRPAATLATGNFTAPGLGYDISGVFSELLTVALIGAFAFVVGYVLPQSDRLGRRLPALPADLRPRPTVRYAMVLAAAALLLLTLFIYQSGGLSALQELLRGRTAAGAEFFSASNQYISQGVYLLIPAALLLMAVRTSEQEGRVKLLAMACVVAVIVVSFPLGTRRWLIAMVGSAFALFFLQRESRPAVLPLLLVALVVLGGVTFYRQARVAAVREDGGAISIAIESFANPGASLRTIALGDDSVPSLAFAVELTAVPQSVPYQAGAGTFADLAFSPIPRNVWPGKPISAVDKLRTHLWGRPCDASPGGSCLDVTILGDFYLDLGIPGVIGGMFLFGLGSRSLYSYYRANQSNRSVQLVYAATLPFFALAIRAGLVPVVGWMGMVLGPLLLGVLLASGRGSGSGDNRVRRKAAA
jgi:hypothetical protein